MKHEPGSCYTNPIWYRRKWRIYESNISGWTWIHDDYDGTEDANDYRYGHEATIDECKAAIDEWEEEHAE